MIVYYKACPLIHLFRINFGKENSRNHVIVTKHFIYKHLSQQKNCVNSIACKKKQDRLNDYHGFNWLWDLLMT